MKAALHVVFDEGADLTGLNSEKAQWDKLFKDFYQQTPSCTVQR